MCIRDRRKPITEPTVDKIISCWFVVLCGKPVEKVATALSAGFCDIRKYILYMKSVFQSYHKRVSKMDRNIIFIV